MPTKAKRKKKDDQGNETEEDERYLILKGEKGDNIESLAEQTGIDIEKLKKDLSLLSAMASIMTGVETDLSKTIGEGSELTSLFSQSNFSAINKALNYTPEECHNMNNCYQASQELALGKDISTDGSFSIAGTTDEGADMSLKGGLFINVSNPKTGDYVRFAKPGGNKGKRANWFGGGTHAATFLLKNKKGMQVFTKNGHEARQYNVMYTTDQMKEVVGTPTILESYGNPTGLLSDTPFYRKK